MAVLRSTVANVSDCQTSSKAYIAVDTFSFPLWDFKEVVMPVASIMLKWFQHLFLTSLKHYMVIVDGGQERNLQKPIVRLL